MTDDILAILKEWQETAREQEALLIEMRPLLDQQEALRIRIAELNQSYAIHEREKDLFKRLRKAVAEAPDA